MFFNVSSDSCTHSLLSDEITQHDETPIEIATSPVRMPQWNSAPVGAVHVKNIVIPNNTEMANPHNARVIKTIMRKLTTWRTISTSFNI